jgi:hypothetical protein
MDAEFFATLCAVETVVVESGYMVSYTTGNQGQDVDD